MRAECMRSQYSRGEKEVMGVSPADCKSRLVGWEVANTSKKGFTKCQGAMVIGKVIRASEGSVWKWIVLRFLKWRLVVEECGEPECRVGNYLNRLLMWFEVISDLKINLIKSEFIPIERVENMEELAIVLGCRVGVLPTSYLGLPQGALHNSLRASDGVEERFHKRLVM